MPPIISHERLLASIVLSLPSEFLLKCLSFVLFIIAEKFLQSNEAKENYNVLLLQLVAEASTDGLIRIAAAISFKNSVKRNWRIVSFVVSHKTYCSTQ